MRSSRISTSGCVLALDRKGGRVNLRIDEPAEIAVGRVGDPGEHLDGRAVVALLELDEVLPSYASAERTEPVVRQAEALPCALDPARYEEEWGVPAKSFDLLMDGRLGHVAYL